MSSFAETMEAITQAFMDSDGEEAAQLAYMDARDAAEDKYGEVAE